MEVLQFAYFSRQKAGGIGIDVVNEMLKVCDENLQKAVVENAWFQRNFVDLRKGNALNLPVEDCSVDVAAQNCLFNIFIHEDLKKALAEMYRVLKPHGRLVLSDPVTENPMPEVLKNNTNLRAFCLSGSLPLAEYLKMITDAGFGTIEIRAKRPYRILAPNHYETSELILLESVEVCAIKDPMPADGPCIFTGKTAIYFGSEAYFDDLQRHVLMANQPISICDKTAKALSNLGRADIHISNSTYFYDGGGCC